MFQLHVRPTFVAVFMLAGSTVACGAEGGSEDPTSETAEKGFDFAPDATELSAEKDVESAELSAKGSANRKYGPAFTVPVTIAPGQTVTYSTTGGSNAVDPVLVLFRRHDNSTNFGAPFTQRPGLQTLAINDDTNFRDSFISYKNNSGVTENARLMLFAYGDATGQVTLSGHGLVSFSAGSIRTSGNAGVAWTSGSSGGADPWLFTFDNVPGQGNGAWNDDSPLGTLESRIDNATSAEMWYVAHQYSSSTGTTTINF